MMTGVFFSQLILLVSTPVLTRLFPPEYFGAFAFFMSITSILVVLSTLRYEHSFVLPKKDNDAYDIMQITIRILFFFTALIFCFIFFFDDFFIALLDNQLINKWIYILPFFVLINSIFFIYRSWLVRTKKFQRISNGAILKSFVLSCLLILGGYFFNNILVFLVANFIAQIIESLYLYLSIKKQEFNKKNSFSQLWIYKDFPKFSLPSDLISTYTSQNPIILFSYFFGDAVVGFFSLTQKVLAVPIKLISSSTLEVYKQKASEDYNKKGNCKEIFKSTFQVLFLIGIVPTLILWFSAPSLFSFVFGSEWIDSGIYAKYLLPMFFLQFSVSPLSYTLYIAGKQNINLYWQICLLFITTSAIYFGVHYDSVDLAVSSFAISYSFMYIIYFLIIYKSSLGNG